jgi:hypothetical protein
MVEVDCLLSLWGERKLITVETGSWIENGFDKTVSAHHIIPFSYMST